MAKTTRTRTTAKSGLKPDPESVSTEAVEDIDALRPDPSETESLIDAEGEPSKETSTDAGPDVGEPTVLDATIEDPDTDAHAAEEEAASTDGQADETPDIGEPELLDATIEEPQAEPAPEPAPVAPLFEPESRTETTVIQKVSPTALFAGGVICAALGFAVAWFVPDMRGDSTSAQMTAQADRIAALESQMAEGPDLSALDARLTEVGTQLTDATDSLTAQIGTLDTRLTDELAALDTRLTAAERTPEVDGTLAETAIASWQQELDGLRAEIEAQQQRMTEIATSAEAELEATRAAAENVEQNAEAAAQEAIARAALARVQAAVDQGMPFDAALGDLAAAGTAIPPALSDTATDGVPTLAALRDAYPSAAREALSAARTEGLADTNAGTLMRFMRNQFDVRSVTPRDGDDPDAILSRAEAALAQNRLTDALAEIESLPEVARAEMSDWIAQAQMRADALAAVETLDTSLNN